MAAFSGFARQLVDGGSTRELGVIIAGFIPLGLSFGQASGPVASGFAATNRYTGTARTSDLAWLIGAGFAPLAALALSARFVLFAAGGYLLSVGVARLVAL